MLAQGHPQFEIYEDHGREPNDFGEHADWGCLAITDWIAGIGWFFKDLRDAETGPDFDDSEDVGAGTDSGTRAIQLERADASD